MSAKRRKAAMTPTRSLLTLSVALFPACGAWAAGPAITPRMPTPLRLAEGGPAYATRLALDDGSYAQLREADEVVLTGFHLDAATRVDLALERFDVLTPDARIVVGTGAGRRAADRPDVVLLRGSIIGEPGSSVFLGLSPHGSNGIIHNGGRRHIISSRPGTGAAPVIYDLDRLPPGAIEFVPFECGLDLLPDFEPSLGAPGGIAGDPPDCSQAAEIAVETDWEYTNELFAGDTQASAAYAVELIGAISEIYLRDVGKTLLVGFLRVWGGEDPNVDPWPDQYNDQGAEVFDGIDLLYEFREQYDNTLEEPVTRHTAHFLSARSVSDLGGVAYLPGLCQGDGPEGFAYGLSTHLNGAFPYPLEDHNGQNWDVLVVAHELGHNFNAPHTHAMSPPIDECAYGDCSIADQGTIMSYCHTCEGGVANIVLRFHERIIDEEILPYLENDLPCALTPNEVQIVEQPEGGIACLDEIFAISVVAQGEPLLAYQWYHDLDPILDAVFPTLIIDPVEQIDSGVYYVEITDGCGGMVESDAVTVYVSDCAEPGPCPWDLDETGDVGVTDFLLLLAEWGPCDAPPCDADFDHDGSVGVTDFLDLLGHWGGCPD
jgi:hypothetical protein